MITRYESRLERRVVLRLGLAELEDDVERGEAVLDGAHVVEPPLRRALLPSPGTAEEVHGQAGSGGVHNVLATAKFAFFNLLATDREIGPQLLIYFMVMLYFFVLRLK